MSVIPNIPVVPSAPDWIPVVDAEPVTSFTEYDERQQACRIWVQDLHVQIQYIQSKMWDNVSSQRQTMLTNGALISDANQFYVQQMEYMRQEFAGFNHPNQFVGPQIIPSAPTYSDVIQQHPGQAAFCIIEELNAKNPL